MSLICVHMSLSVGTHSSSTYMQSTGHTITHTGQPEHNSGTMMTSSPRSKMAPNSGGQLRTHVSHVMHSDDSIRRGGFFHVSLRDRVTRRSDRPGRAPVEPSLPLGIPHSPPFVSHLTSTISVALVREDVRQNHTEGAAGATVAAMAPDGIIEK